MLMESLLAHAQNSRHQTKQQLGQSTPRTGLTTITPAEVSAALTRTETLRARRPEVFFCQTADPQCRTSADTFMLEEIRDLFIFVTWPNVVGKHVQTLQFILPDGHLYQRKDTAFTIRPQVPARPGPPGGRVPRRRNRNTEPRPHDYTNTSAPAPPEPFLTMSRGDPSVITVLPVAGTFITQHNLSGTWTVKVLLDDKPVLSAQFTLKTDGGQ